MSIGTFVNSLVNTPEHPILLEVLKCINTDESAAYTTDFAFVTQLLKKTIKDDFDKSAFESTYLKRVIKHFSDEIEEQCRQRQILEAILRYAAVHCKFQSAKIPQLIKLNRDTPALPPTSLMFARQANTLFNVIKADLLNPTKLNSKQLEVGRLLAVLFLFEGIPDLASSALVLRHYKLYYAGSIIYLTDQDDETGQKRFVIQLYTALLIQRVKRYEQIDYIVERASRSSKMTAGYIQQYLRLITKQSKFNITVSQLSFYRKIYWTNRYSPIETEFFLHRMKSVLLPTEILIRTLTDKSASLVKTELSVKADPVNHSTRKTFMQHKRLHGATYQNVEQSITLVKLLISYIKPSSKQAAHVGQTEKSNAQTHSSNEKKPYQAIITLITNQLKNPEFSQNFFVILFGRYIINLLKNGGSRKKLLARSTIRDYVSAPLKAFISVFADTDLLMMDEEALTDKFNCVSELMAPTKRSCLYYLAYYIQQLGLVTDFKASNLDISAKSGKVNANVISVPQIEYLLQFIKNAGDVYSDAILLVCLGFYSGARRSEAKYIRVSDFEVSQSANGTKVSVRIVPTKARTIKSRSGTRTINLNVFWPKPWLELLVNKLTAARSAGVSKTTRLFDDSADKHFSIISQLLRSYLRDNGFSYHVLRHSFVCWQYYRLVLQPRLKGARAQSLHCFDHDYFSDEACLKARNQLGLPAISRKSVFTLCSLVGHRDPSITFESYLHLKDVYCYLLMSSDIVLKQKTLSYLVPRATLNTELLQYFPAGAITFGSLSDEQTLNILPAPELKHSKPLNIQQLELKPITMVPCLRQIEHGLQFIGKIEPDEITAVENDTSVITIEGSWLTKLNDVCNEVHRHYPARGARLPKIPQIARSKDQLRSDKPLSRSRSNFEGLQAKTQLLLDSKRWSDSKIYNTLQVLKGLLIKQMWTIQFREPGPFGDFLALCREILPENIQPRATFHFTDSEHLAKDVRWFLTSWDRTFANYDIKPELKPDYWVNALEPGVVWLYFEDTIEDKDIDQNGESPLRTKIKRASSVMKFMHFLLVATKTRVYLTGNDRQINMKVD